MGGWGWGWGGDWEREGGEEKREMREMRDGGEGEEGRERKRERGGGQRHTINELCIIVLLLVLNLLCFITFDLI